MVSFIETTLFTRLVQEYLTDDQYRELQAHLIDDPKAGAVIPSSGGVRKLRWGTRGPGKSGGYRIIYFVQKDPGVLWMLTMYPKNVQENIPAGLLRKIRKEVENG
jgi:hypothetical protein